MSKVFGFAIVWVAFLIVTQSGFGQNWRDPAFQQPLPQYYPPNRYPLDVPERPTAPPSRSPLSPRQTQSLETLGEPSVIHELPSPSSSKTKSQSATGAKGSAKPKAKPPTKKDTAPKKSASKKSASKGKDKPKKKDKAEEKSHPIIDFSIYRDQSQFPIDPRKPCSTCKRSVNRCNCGIDHGPCGPGNHGQPHQDREPGGYACGKNCPDKRPMFSVYWPRPFSAKHTPGHPHRCNCDQCATRINDRFDHLIEFKLIDYQRKDNGYCGPEADPFGCLGESKYLPAEESYSDF
jgi:hypothetical protein